MAGAICAAAHACAFPDDARQRARSSNAAVRVNPMTLEATSAWHNQHQDYKSKVKGRESI